MRSAIIVLLAASGLAACANPVAQQAAVDTRHDAVRSDSMLAVNFASGTSRLDDGQVGALRDVVEAGRRAQRDEFAVVTDGSGGPMQQARAQRVAQVLSDAGARWVSTAVEPAMAMGPAAVVVVRSEYLIAGSNCPTYTPAGMWNPNEAAMPGYGCADAYNMGQMLARPRDAVVGRPPGFADGTVNAEAVARYREGKVRPLNSTGMIGVGTGGGTTAGSN
ncbi:MAG: CpaD family pilus assembly protein [Reyranella sp.]|nr:CpaD family pilus assembly protein [Reyranella sp.]